jgi:probable HAF family extracellular repeat protein
MKNSAVVLVTVLFLASVASAQSYTVTDLGTLLGDSTSAGAALNGAGEVVGFLSTTVQHGFLWSAGRGMLDLPPLPGGNFSIAVGINAGGVVAGTSTTKNGGNDHAVLWINGKIQDLGTLPGGTASLGSAINASRQVAGGSDTGTTSTHAILWTKTGGMQDLGVLGGAGGYSLAEGINRFGEVVGESSIPGSINFHGFSWTTASGMRDLGILPGGSFSVAYGLNDLGQIIGYADCGVFCFHAVLWGAGGNIRDLGSLPHSTESSAFSINNAGHVVGWAFLPGAVYHGFVWSQNAGMLDLNDLIPAGSGWTIEFAIAINGSDQITGRGTINGQEHAFLLTPAGAAAN